LFTSRGPGDAREQTCDKCDVPVGRRADPELGRDQRPGIKAGGRRQRSVYAVPGVPYEMQLMISEHVLPDLLPRSGQQGAIVSRSLKTWGTSEFGGWPR